MSLLLIGKIDRSNSGRGRPRYPVRSMLLALLLMRFEAIPSMRKLCRRLEKRRYARDICEFNGDRTPKHNTFDRSIFLFFFCLLACDLGLVC